MNSYEALGHRHALTCYREERAWRPPSEAAREALNTAARHLADRVLDGHPNEWAVQNYRTARAIYDAVVERAALGSSRRAKTPTEWYWTLGKLSRTAVTS